MHIDISFTNRSGKVYKRVLLRTSYREGKKVKHKTIANLSQESDETIEAIRAALKNKHDINKFLVNVADSPQMKKGPSVGAIYVLLETSKRLSLTNALGATRAGNLALWQVFARIIDQGSRLSAVRLAGRHAVCDILKLDSFTEDDLYSNLEWLSLNQSEIEQKLFKYKQSILKPVSMFLYDVTSSYTEGEKNEYSEFGYNRDKKKGKKQIVVGLLTDVEGDPVSVQVFYGNTKDNNTVVEQVHKIRNKFGISDVIFVGDRGMIKSPLIKELGKDFQYVTAITKPQIQTLIKNNKLKLDDFSDELKEITDIETSLRYILRRNPVRSKEIAEGREAKLQSLKNRILKKSEYLKEHPKASVVVAAKEMRSYARKLKIHSWAIVRKKGSSITVNVNEDKLNKESEFDGCYVIKSNVIDSPSQASSQILHERYKDLSQVEWAFRTMKTTHLDIRPYYVTKSESTDGHVLVVMLAYKLIRYLKEAWTHIDVTVEEGIDALVGLHSNLKGNNPTCQYIPQPDALVEKLLAALNINFPDVLPYKEINVATRKKLVSER